MRFSSTLLSRRTFIIGGSVSPFLGKGNPAFIDKRHPDFGKKENPTLEQLITQSINETLSSSSVDAELVDRVVVGNFAGELFSSQGHLGSAAIGAHPKLLNKPSMRCEGACASGALAMQVGVDAIRSGGADLVLVIGAEVQTTVPPRQGGDFLARASHYSRQRKIDDFTFPCLFAKRMKAIVAANHFSMEDTAMVAVKAYTNGNANPLAHMHSAKHSFQSANFVSERNPLFLANPEYKDYLRISDCSQVTDGAASIILASEEGMKRVSRSTLRCAEIKALVCATGNLYVDPSDMTRLQTCTVAAHRALEEAKISALDLQVAEVHDCFTIAEILMYEALGIAPYGKGRDLINNGDTGLGGRIPVNTGGGLLSFGHPVGATGVKQVLELYRQMHNMCGEYQMKRSPTIGAALNMGGDDKTAVCTVLHAH